jgi:hypothetical protein
MKMKIKTQILEHQIKTLRKFNNKAEKLKKLNLNQKIKLVNLMKIHKKLEEAKEIINYNHKILSHKKIHNNQENKQNKIRKILENKIKLMDKSRNNKMNCQIILTRKMMIKENKIYRK